MNKLKFTELLNEAWEIAGKKFWRLLGIYLMTTVVMVLIAAAYVLCSALVMLIAGLLNIPALLAVLAAPLILGLILVVIWLSSWQIAAVYSYLEGSEDQTVVPLLKNTWPAAKKLWPTIALSSLVILSGYIFFVIPGIVMAISLAFVGIVAVIENKHLWDALVRSRELVRGRWWNVFGQMLALIIFCFVAILVTGFQYSPLAVILTPFVYVYTYVIYKKLAASPVAGQQARGDWYYKAAAILGTVLIAGGLILGSIALVKNWDKIVESFKQQETQDLPYEEAEIQYQYPEVGPEEST